MPHKIAFRNRAHEVTRVEAISDVVFGFSISLLVVSLEAPKTYGQMMEMLHGFLPFAICFWIFIDIWFEHHKFFRRYGLDDNPTLFLNTCLLFVILFYVYPLKYMFTLSIQTYMGHPEPIPLEGARVLFTVYGVGVMAVFWLLAGMYAHALRKRGALELNAVELIDTRERVYDNLFMGLFGFVSVALANAGFLRLAGPIYFLIAVPKTLVPWIFGVKRNKTEEAMLASAPQFPGPRSPEQSPAH
jgi:uncharacterized membrane protein